MKQRKLTIWDALGDLSLTDSIIRLIIIIGGGCGCLYYLSIQEPTSPVLLDKLPEVIFQVRFMDGLPIPAEVSEIYGVEGSGYFGESPGPAYIRFKATSSFIQELVTKDYGRNGIYTPAPCQNVPYSDFYIEQFPERFEWWQPLEVASPVCYRAHTCTLYDEKFLLVDPANSIVYFYRTPVCGLCPSGQTGAEL